jgi:hypothetical protein
MTSVPSDVTYNTEGGSIARNYQLVVDTIVDNPDEEGKGK